MFGYPRRCRLSGSRQYEAVFGGNVRKHRGPLTVWGRPNGLDHCRLGLSVSRRVGNSVKRNYIKRLLREAFRLSQPQFPAGHDLVVVVKPHTPVSLPQYQAMLVDAVTGLHRATRR